MLVQRGRHKRFDQEVVRCNVHVEKITQQHALWETDPRKGQMWESEVKRQVSHVGKIR